MYNLFHVLFAVRLKKLTSAGSAMAANTAGAAPAQASAAATAPAPQTASGAAASTTPAAQQPSNEDKIAKYVSTLSSEVFKVLNILI